MKSVDTKAINEGFLSTLEKVTELDPPWKDL